jgi:hypothetical protein
MAKNVAIEFFSGNTALLKFTVDDEDNPGSPKNLAGATDIKWAIAKQQGKTPLVIKSLADAVTVTDDVNGKVEVLLVPADSEALAGLYYHEMRVTDAAGNVATTTYGDATVQDNSIQ